MGVEVVPSGLTPLLWNFLRLAASTRTQIKRNLRVLRHALRLPIDKCPLRCRQPRSHKLSTHCTYSHRFVAQSSQGEPGLILETEKLVAPHYRNSDWRSLTEAINRWIGAIALLNCRNLYVFEIWGLTAYKARASSEIDIRKGNRR